MNAVTIGLAWMASLGAVFLLGILLAFAFHLKPGAGGSSTSDLSLDQREMLLVIERYTGKVADIGQIVSTDNDDILPEQVEQTIRAITREPNPAWRQSAAERLARGLPLRKRMKAIQFMQNFPSDPGRNQTLGAFLEIWAKDDGRRAIAYATSLETLAEREVAIASVLSGWASSDPVTAWKWVVEEVESSRRAERLLSVVVASLSEADRTTAFDLLERLPASEFRDQMAGAVMGQILQTQTPQEAVVWLSDFPASTQQAVGAILAIQWAGSDPQAAVQWLYQSFPAELGGMGSVVQEWAYYNPSAAADWVWRTYGGIERRVLIDLVAEEWLAIAGPAALAEWLNQYVPHTTLDGAIEQLALSVAEIDPAMALGWAHSIIDLDAQSTLEIVIGQAWIRAQPDEAAEELPDLLYSETARAALLVAEAIEEPLPAN